SHVGPARPDRRQLTPRRLDRLRHVIACVGHYVLDHVVPPKELPPTSTDSGAPTKVPISSPNTARSMLRSAARSNTINGRLLSMQRAKAVLSMTASRRVSASL